LAEESDCDLKQQNSYLYTTGGTERLEEEMDACNQLGISAQWKFSLPLPFAVTGAIAIPEQAQFHPMKLAAYIAKDLPIYENTKALSFSGNRVQIPNGTVTADKIIVATHFPLINKHGAYFLKLYQQRSYVIALENAFQPEGMYLDCAENGLSIRSAGSWLLLGGGGHRTGKKGMGWKLPELAAEKFYPHAQMISRWATQDCMTLDGMPYIGHYSKATPNLYVATGFQKWGMSSSMVAATVLCDLIQEKENPYASLFDPSRSMIHRQLLCNGVEAAVNLLRPVKPRCPHMGCALNWNQAERSWDCPCHGSRFDEDGKLLNNPATDDMKKPPRKKRHL
jgi:glycine/D-amino acid oxidase-like deaminating enzyme